MSDIVDIYLNLGEETAFCEAVGRDGRSYSATLFDQTENVLRKIGRPATVVFRLGELSKRIKDIVLEEKQDMPEVRLSIHQSGCEIVIIMTLCTYLYYYVLASMSECGLAGWHADQL